MQFAYSYIKVKKTDKFAPDIYLYYRLLLFTHYCYGEVQRGVRFYAFLHQYKKISNSWVKQFTWPQGYKTFSMLNSAEHEILNAHKYKNVVKFIFFSGSDKPRMLFFLLISVKMPTMVGILTFMSMNFFSCSDELSMKKYNPGIWSYAIFVAYDQGLHCLSTVL